MEDDEIEKLEEDLLKDINQSDSIDQEIVDQELQGMGFLKSVLDKKLNDDGICFKCKKDINFKIDTMHVKTAKSDKGTVAFVGLCSKCNKELEEESQLQEH